MLIKEDHLLYFDEDTPVEFDPSPNFTGNIETNQRQGKHYLIMHYTAGSNIEGAIEELKREDDSPVSAHLVIGRDGRIVQLVPFNRVAYHAGYAHWETTQWLNYHSIGIELDNDGFLIPDGELWKNPKVDIHYIREEVHFEKCWKPKWYEHWLKYPQVQLDAALEVSKVLVATYGLIDILGHEDIHPEKQDPGPAFPMADFRRTLFGVEAASFKPHEVTRTVTVYKDVDKDNFKQGVPPVLPQLHELGRLPKGIPVKKMRTKDPWTRITVGKKDLKDHNIQVDKKIQAWVESVVIQQKKLVQDACIYADSEEPPVDFHPINYDGPIQAGDRVQIFYETENFALIRSIHPNKYVQGWIIKDCIKKDPG